MCTHIIKRILLSAHKINIQFYDVTVKRKLTYDYDIHVIVTLIITFDFTLDNTDDNYRSSYSIVI